MSRLNELADQIRDEAAEVRTSRDIRFRAEGLTDAKIELLLAMAEAVEAMIRTPEREP